MSAVRRPALPTVVFAAWTAFVWATRIRNIAGDDDLTAWGQVWRYGLAASFLVLAVAVLVRPALLRAAVIWTVIVWVVRDTGIVIDDRTAAFKLVHAALGVISISLGAWAWLPSAASAERAGARRTGP